MKSRLPGLLLWSLAGFFSLAGTTVGAQPASPPVSAAAPGPASPGGAAVPAQGDNLPDLGLIGWTVPPIRLSGNTSSTYIYNTDFLGSTSLSDTQLMSGRASSYIYAPWFAQVNLNAGLGTTAAKNDSTSATSKANSTSINFGGNVNLFPLSRFPFSAYLDSSDSRAKAVTSGNESAASTQYNSLRLGARQYYRPETGNDSYNASADYSLVTSGSIRSIVNAFQGGYSTNFEDHSLSGTARFSSTSGDVGGQGSQLFGAGGNHTWQIPDEGLTINNSLNFSSNDIKTLSTTGSGLVVNNSHVLQASSYFSWLPDEDLPLTITGGGGFLNTGTQTDTTTTSLINFNSFVGATYRINNNLTASGGATLASTSTTNAGAGLSQPDAGAQATTRLLTTSQNASLSYTGDPLVFENISYNWGGGGNLSNQTNSIGGSNRVLGGSAHHGVSTSLPLSPTSMLALNASQSVGLNASSSTAGSGGANQSTLLNHSVGAVWRANVGQISIVTVSANASDTLSTGTYSNHLRSFSSTGNFQTQLSARATLTASANISVSQQLSTPQNFTTTTTALGTTTTATPPTSWLGNGQIAYSHRSPFDIANLLYTASFTANANQSNLRIVTGDPNALSWQVARVFSQQATYRLGRLAFQATASMAWTGDGRKNATVFGSISREIGDF